MNTKEKWKTSASPILTLKCIDQLIIPNLQSRFIHLAKLVFWQMEPPIGNSAASNVLLMHTARNEYIYVQVIYKLTTDSNPTKIKP